MKSKVVLVSGDSDTTAGVRAALDAHEGASLANVCKDLPTLAALLELEQVSVAVVDLGEDPHGMLKRIQDMVSRFPGVSFVVLARASENDLIFESMVIGARYFLLKDSIDSSLAGALERLSQNSHHVPSRGGAIISLYSAGGGCGATTIAVNLANELKLLSAKRTLLVDMDGVYGGAGLYLGMSSHYGIADVLNRNGEVDPSLIGSTSLLHSENLHVLVSPASANLARPKPLAYHNLPSVLDACRHAYEYTVVDAPRVPAEAITALADFSSISIIVFQLQVKDIRFTQAMISALKEGGMSPDRIVPVANRYRKHNPMISFAEAREALDDMAVECVANDYRSALRGINYGQPLAQSAPRSTLRKDLRRLATKIDQKVESASRAAVSET